jgi:hypothetical protein
MACRRRRVINAAVALRSQDMPAFMSPGRSNAAGEILWTKGSWPAASDDILIGARQTGDLVLPSYDAAYR